jgi:hypothetical protein
VSVLGLYDHMRFDAPEFDDLDDDAPSWPTEAVTAANGAVWWSAALSDDDDE